MFNDTLNTNALDSRVNNILARLYSGTEEGQDFPIDDDGFLPEDLENELQNIYTGLVNSGCVSFEIFEGLDGAGKTTQLRYRNQDYLSKGYNIISAHFPQYITATGQVIRGFLRGEHLLPGREAYEEPYVKLKMSYYALNRLDAIRGLQIDALRLYAENHRPVKIIFDRSHLANIATLAYSWKAENDQALPENWEYQIERYLKFMLWIDADFVDMLGIPEDVPVIFPVLPSTMIEAAIEGDKSRGVIDRKDGEYLGTERRKQARTDINENEIVQRYMLYIIRYFCDKQLLPNLQLIEQVDGNGVRVSADQVYQIINSKVGIVPYINEEADSDGHKRPRILVLHLNYDQIRPRSYREKLMKMMMDGLDKNQY